MLAAGGRAPPCPDRSRDGRLVRTDDEGLMTTTKRPARSADPNGDAPKSTAARRRHPGRRRLPERRRRRPSRPASTSGCSIRIGPTRSSSSRRPSTAGSAITSSCGSTSRVRSTTRSRRGSRSGWSSARRRVARSGRPIAARTWRFTAATSMSAWRPRRTREPSESPHWLDLVAAGNVVLTSHAEPVAFLRDLDDRVEADTNVGVIDAPAFVATAIDSAVTSYFKSVDEIEEDGRAPRPARPERAAGRRRPRRPRGAAAPDRPSPPRAERRA